MRSRIVRANEEDFDVAIRGSAWQACESLDAVDCTIEIDARSAREPERRIVGLVHGNVSRATTDGPFVVTLGANHVREVVEDALFEPDVHRVTRHRVDNARWCMNDCPVPHTRAPRYAGAAGEILETKLALGSKAWMQDWPLEVSNPARVEELCTFHDRESDPDVRFDTMQLVLYSWNQRARSDALVSAWLARTLRRDFALHGHTIAYWAALELESDDPELHLPEPEHVFWISGMPTPAPAASARSPRRTSAPAPSAHPATVSPARQAAQPGLRGILSAAEGRQPHC